MSFLHIGTYMQMGDDFDSRNRYLRKPADGVYEGQIVAGQSWSVNVVNNVLALRFQMGSYVLTVRSNDGNSGVYVNPTGTSTGITTS